MQESKVPYILRWLLVSRYGIDQPGAMISSLYALEAINQRTFSGDCMTTWYKLCAIRAMTAMSWTSVSEGVEPGENTAGAESR